MNHTINRLEEHADITCVSFLDFDYICMNIKGGILLANKGLTVGVKAPEFELPATNNQKIRLSDFSKQPVIITFLRGTW